MRLTTLIKDPVRRTLRRVVTIEVKGSLAVREAAPPKGQLVGDCTMTSLAFVATYVDCVESALQELEGAGASIEGAIRDLLENTNPEDLL